MLSLMASNPLNRYKRSKKKHADEDDYVLATIQTKDHQEHVRENLIEWSIKILDTE